QLDAGEAGHGSCCRVVTLSPSDKQFDKFLLQIGALSPIEMAAKKRVPDQGPNHVSVVTAILIGDQAMLFGSDLEEVGDPELGWSAIVALPGRPQQAGMFKIPHHGSKNGHCEEVWDKMLISNPVAVLTPWRRRLPTRDDVERILSF